MSVSHKYKYGHRMSQRAGMPATTATNRILLGGLNLSRPHDGTKKKKKAGAD